MERIKEVMLILLVASFCLVVRVDQAASSELRIVRNGEPIVDILVPGNPSAGELMAAQDLSDYIKKMTGAKLRVVRETENVKDKNIISVGRTRLARDAGITERLKNLSGDSFLVRCQPERGQLYLLGNSDLGTLFSVFHLLKYYFGVRWFLPDELGQVVPKGRDLMLAAADAVHQADIPMRDVGSRRATSWSLFNGSNVNVDEEMGVHFYKQGHTFFDFLPPDRYYKKHPEYFSLVRGQRKPKQLCTSNQDVIREVVRNISLLIAETPRLDVITLFPQDGLGFCECDRCKALDEPGLPSVQEVNSKWRKLGDERYRALSRRMVVFYLSVAERVLGEHPKIRMQVGAYNPYLYPPTDRSLKGSANVLIQICHGWEHNNPVESDASEINVRFKHAMAGWRRIFSDVSIYEYYRKAAMYDLPFPILHSIEKDIAFYKGNGVKAFFTQFDQDYYTNGINYYVASRLLWDSSLTVREVLQDFCEKFYQKAGEAMIEYYMNYEKAATSSGLTLAPSLSKLDRLFTDELIERQDKLLKKAASLATDEAVRERIRRAGVSLEYVRKCMEYMKRAKSVGAGNDVVKGTLSLKKMAEDIREYRKQHKKDYCFGAENNYVNRFLDYKWLLAQVVRDEGDAADEES
jgi:hypothetical protein